MTTFAIDARAAAEVAAGRGRFVRELLLALDARDDDVRYRLYGRSAWGASLGDRFAWHTRRLPEGPWHLWAARHASRHADVFLSTNSYLTAWFTTVPTAVLVYDLIAFMPSAAPQRRAAMIERRTVRPALRRAATLLCISDATRRDLEERFPAARGKTAVVPLAAARIFASGGSPVAGVEPGFVLCVGTLEPRKNLVRTIDAYRSLPLELRAVHPLVVAGARGWEEDEILASARAVGARILTGLPDDQLAWLYAHCAVFMFPSLYEGFGLPLLEAMSAGAACITSNTSSLPEVGGDAARYVDPTSVGQMRDELARLLAAPDARRALGAQARARAAQYSWSRTAEIVLDALRGIAGASSA